MDHEFYNSDNGRGRSKEGQQRLPKSIRAETPSVRKPGPGRTQKEIMDLYDFGVTKNPKLIQTTECTTIKLNPEGLKPAFGKPDPHVPAEPGPMVASCSSNARFLNPSMSAHDSSCDKTPVFYVDAWPRSKTKSQKRKKAPSRKDNLSPTPVEKQVTRQIRKHNCEKKVSDTAIRDATVARKSLKKQCKSATVRQRVQNELRNESNPIPDEKERMIRSLILGFHSGYKLKSDLGEGLGKFKRVFQESQKKSARVTVQ